MNSTVLVHHASLLNAEGVQALTTGDGAAAHQRFRQALEVMSHATQFAAQQPVNGNAFQRIAVSCCPVPGFEKSNFYVCNNALIFSVDQQQEAMDASAIAVCCNSTMFNMALTLHQRGLQTGSQRNLISAGRMYEQCLRLGADLEGPQDDVNILAVASLNNASQIHYDLGDFDQAVAQLQTVRQLVAETDCVSPGLAQVLSLDNVILNVLTTSKPTTAPCA